MGTTTTHAHYMALITRADPSPIARTSALPLTTSTSPRNVKELRIPHRVRTMVRRFRTAFPSTRFQATEPMGAVSFIRRTTSTVRASSYKATHIPIRIERCRLLDSGSLGFAEFGKVDWSRRSTLNSALLISAEDGEVCNIRPKTVIGLLSSRW